MCRDLRVTFAEARKNISDAMGLAVGERLSGPVHQKMLEFDADVSRILLAARSKKGNERFDVAFSGRLAFCEIALSAFVLKGEQIGIVHVFSLQRVWSYGNARKPWHDGGEEEIAVLFPLCCIVLYAICNR